jgi:hypothetical protein
MTEPKPKPKKNTFEPLVPLGLFLIVFGVLITIVPFLPASLLGEKEIGSIEKIVNLVSGFAFLAWGGGWLYVGWNRAKRMKEAALQKKDEKL